MSQKYTTGQRFDKLTLLHTIRVNKTTLWVCQCDCGTVVNRLISNMIRQNKTNSCDNCRSRVTSEGKACIKCLVVKSLEQYPTDSRRKDGKRSRCKQCVAEDDLAYRLSDPAKVKASKARWQKDNLSKVNTVTHTYRSRKRGNLVEVVNPLIVFERDNWTCQLCFEPVDSAVRGRQPLAPSLDHIIPVSKGGEHSYDNTQLAHLRCNIVKNDRIISNE